MALASISIDENLKEQFEDLCKKFGTTSSAVISLIAKKAVKENKIPLNPNLLKISGKIVLSEDDYKKFLEACSAPVEISEEDKAFAKKVLAEVEIRD